jgi:hypothetical protein
VQLVEDGGRRVEEVDVEDVDVRGQQRVRGVDADVVLDDDLPLGRDGGLPHGRRGWDGGAGGEAGEREGEGAEHVDVESEAYLSSRSS